MREVFESLADRKAVTGLFPFPIQDSCACSASSGSTETLSKISSTQWPTSLSCARGVALLSSPNGAGSVHPRPFAIRVERHAHISAPKNQIIGSRRNGQAVRLRVRRSNAHGRLSMLPCK